MPRGVEVNVSAQAASPGSAAAPSWRGPILTLLAAVAVALVLAGVDAWGPASASRSLQVKHLFLIAVTGAPCVPILLRDRLRVDPWRLWLRAAVGLAVALAGSFLYWAYPQITFPADILIWSEGDFVNDVLKFRAGHPLYTAQANNDSFTYPPGAQLTTYCIASLFGRPLDVPAYRCVQLGFTLGASVLALLCVRKLARRAAPAGSSRESGWWTALWMPACLLMATNYLTNPFTFLLHNDALALLLILASYLCLLRYTETGNVRLLVVLAALAAAGFLVKQSLLVWCGLPCIHLAFFDRKPSIRRAAAYGIGAGLAAAAVVGACILVWGQPFVFWVLQVLGARSVPLLRVAEHVRDAWAYYAAGLIGGAVLIRGRDGRELLGPWLVWLALIATETYTSAIAFMHNHAGPGSLIGGVWFLAALPRLVRIGRPADGPRPYSSWLRAGSAFLLLYFLFAQMYVVRRPEPPMPTDALRQVAAVEAEFTGVSARDVMVDTGVWMHAREGTFVADLAPSIGERGTSGTGDFSGILERIARHRYARIIVRHLHEPDFWYDSKSFERPSGIRAALLEHYREVRTIPATPPGDWFRPGDRVPYQFGEVSVMEPRGPAGAGGSEGR